jgi:hypothetical protein
MAALQEFPENFFEEETSDQRSILLAEIMNALGFSKSEREINRHYEFVGQPFHDFINSTHYNVFCPFTERNHTILIFMTHFILFKFGINDNIKLFNISLT